MRGAALVPLMTLAAGAVACGGARFDGRVVRGDGFAFVVPPPPARWQKLDRAGSALAFRDESAGATVLLGARCGLDGDDVPLSALTAHLFLQFTERRIDRQEVVPFDGREAMHTVLSAKLDGVSLRYDAWVLKKDGCVYDLVYFAPEHGFARGHEAFAELVRGFATLPAEGGAR
jgi:hypothetical protein